MVHPRVDQLRFARSEWVRGLVGLFEEDAQRRLVPYHYWSHIGEASAVRQILGHPDLPQFVGPIEDMAPYRREDDPG